MECMTRWNAPDPMPPGLALAARLALEAIEQQKFAETEALTAAFISAAWPSRRAQNQ
jgi:hypothetical protein